MSRDRYDRDDYYGGRGRREYEEREPRRGGFRDPLGPDATTEEDYQQRGRLREYDDYGRGYGRGQDRWREAREDFYRTDYETGAVGRRGEREDYDPRRARGYEDERRHGGRGYEEGDREGRSLLEEGRDYLRGRGGETRRGSARSHVRCRDIMTRDVTVATRDTTLEEVARMMKSEDTGVIPVVDRDGTPVSTQPPTQNIVDEGQVGTSPEARRVNATVHGNGRLVGLITDRDIVVRAVAEGRDARTARAEEIMTTDVHTAQPNDRVVEAIRKMGDKQVRRIPIVDRDGILRGIISMADVALETDDDRELQEALEEISSGKSFWSRIFG